MNKSHLKASIEAVAKESNKLELDVITEMQAGAAIIEDEKTLDMLCDLKWDYI